MTSRPMRARRPIARPAGGLCGATPGSSSMCMSRLLARSQEQQDNLARAPLKRAESSEERDEQNTRNNNNDFHQRPRRPPPPPTNASISTLGHSTQHKSSRRDHNSSLNLSSSAFALNQQQRQRHTLKATSVIQSPEAAAAKSSPFKLLAGAAKQRQQPISSLQINERVPQVDQRARQLASATSATGSKTLVSPKPLAQVSRLRWKSSSHALHLRSSNSIRDCQLISRCANNLSAQQQQRQVSSSGEWCCELPHHATGAHLNTRRQSNLTPLLARVQRDLNGLHNKRAASSLSLIINNNNNINNNNDNVSQVASKSSGQRSARQLISAAKPISGSGTRAAPAFATARRAQQLGAISGELATVAQASSQVTNSRLRQGALFARRQLHLLPNSPAGGQSGESASRFARPSAGSCKPTRASANKPVQANPPNSRTTRQQQQQAPKTASEARRRATRQVVVVAASRVCGLETATAPEAATVAANNNNQEEPLKLVKAEKKASHLTSSSSSLSAFIVKRPRQQQHSSTSSSCSSLSTGSRRWSSSSIDANDHHQHQQQSLSQSCSELRSEQADWPPPCTCSQRPLDNLIGGSKAASEQLACPSEPAGEQSASAHTQRAGHERTRFLEGPNGHIATRCQPEQTNGQANIFDSSTRTTTTTGQLIDTQINLLDSSQIVTHLDRAIGIDSNSNNNNQLPDNHRHHRSQTSGNNAFSLTSDEVEESIIGIEQEIQQPTPKAAGVAIANISESEDVDIVAIGCSPVAFVVEAPVQFLPTTTPLSRTTDNFPVTPTPQKTSLQLAPDHTMPTGATSCCNTNEYQLIVASNNNNNNGENHQSNFQGDVQSAKTVDMQISLGISGDEFSRATMTPASSPALENINNNIDINEQPAEAAVINKGLTMSPLDLSSKTFNWNAASQEPKQTHAPTATSITNTTKSQPLGLHQSINIAANCEVARLQSAPNTPTIIGKSELCCDADVGSIQPACKRRDSLQSTTQQANSREPQVSEQNNVIARQQKMAEIPIRLEPISDFYDLESRPFARGKFAQVKRCTRKSSTASMSMGECYAAKCIKKRRRLVDIKHEILLEIEALKLSYETKHIVRLYEVYETQNEMVLVLEMAKGGELQRVLDDEEQIEESLVRKMIDQILEGLIHLHDNEIAHLDIKPQNLLLSAPFPDGDIKLCDFGISRRISKECEIREICGTPDYVAPEILRYDPISLATDMWSLGVLTYVLLSGYSPFGSDNKQQTFCNITQATLDFPQEIFAKISLEAVDFVRKLIVREPAERLTSRQAKQHHWISNQHPTG